MAPKLSVMASEIPVAGLPSDFTSGESAQFEREGMSFSEQIVPSDDPQGAIDELRSAVSECFGVETPMSSQDATVSFSPLANATR